MLCRSEDDLDQSVKRSSREGLTSCRIVVMPSVPRPVCADGSMIERTLRQKDGEAGEHGMTCCQAIG
jgi:hypothetical protein